MSNCLENSTASASQVDPRQQERRTRTERRQLSATESGYEGKNRRKTTMDRRSGLQRRRGPGIRRDDDRRAAEEGEMTTYQFEFIMAVDAYKKTNRRMYPTLTEILEVFRQLGYKKVLPRSVDLDNCPEAPIEKVA